jgi:hypothetical protein
MKKLRGIPMILGLWLPVIFGVEPIVPCSGTFILVVLMITRQVSPF